MQFSGQTQGGVAELAVYCVLARWVEALVLYFTEYGAFARRKEPKPGVCVFE